MLAVVRKSSMVDEIQMEPFEHIATELQSLKRRLPSVAFTKVGRPSAAPPLWNLLWLCS